MTDNKQALADALFENQNKYISGQELAVKLGVSRNAIWKLTENLRDEGFEIAALNNKGYRLVSPPSHPHPCVIRYFLPSSLKSTAVICKKTTTSTNSDARAISAETAENVIVTAQEQTAGRGRCGKSFFSPRSEGLYFSMLLHPKASISECARITTATAVAVREVLAEVAQRETEIKWVNDLFYKGKKVCGILTESVADFETMSVDAVIVGIGINLCNKAFPTELESIAGTLDCPGVLSGILVARIFSRTAELCEKLSDKGFLEEYKKHCFVLGKEIRYEKNGCVHNATAIDIDENGGLVIRENGTVCTLTSGEVSIKI